VNFGKKRSFLKFKKSKKNPIPSHTEKSFTISILKKKKIPNYYYILALFVIFTKLNSQCI